MNMTNTLYLCGDEEERRIMKNSLFSGLSCSLLTVLVSGGQVSFSWRNKSSVLTPTTSLSAETNSISVIRSHESVRPSCQLTDPLFWCVCVCSERSSTPRSLQIQTWGEADGEDPRTSRGHCRPCGYASHYHIITSSHHQVHSHVCRAAGDAGEAGEAGEAGVCLCCVCRQRGLPGAAFYGICAAPGGGPAGVCPGGSCPCEVPLPPARPAHRQHGLPPDRTLHLHAHVRQGDSVSWSCCTAWTFMVWWILYDEFCPCLLCQNFHEAAYQADDRQDLLAAINRFLDCSVVLPPSEVGDDELLHSVARFQRDMLRKREEEQSSKVQEKQTSIQQDEGPLSPPD